MASYFCSQVKEAHVAWTDRVFGPGVVGFMGVEDCFVVPENCIL